MIATFKRRPFAQFKATGYSTEEVEEMIDDKRVSVYTDKEAEEMDIGPVRGRAPRSIMESIEVIKDD